MKSNLLKPMKYSLIISVMLTYVLLLSGTVIADTCNIRLVNKDDNFREHDATTDINGGQNKFIQIIIDYPEQWAPTNVKAFTGIGKPYVDFGTCIEYLNVPESATITNLTFDYTYENVHKKGDYKIRLWFNQKNAPGIEIIDTFSFDRGPQSETIIRHRETNLLNGQLVKDVQAEMLVGFFWTTDDTVYYPGTDLSYFTFDVEWTYAFSSIVDNTDSETYQSNHWVLIYSEPSFIIPLPPGPWKSSTSISGFYGTDYYSIDAGVGDRTFTWYSEIERSGTYEVFAYWPADISHTSEATYSIKDSGGTSSVVVNQTTNGNQWVYLGTYHFDSASNAEISLDNSGNGIVVADAVKIVYVP